MCWVGRGFSALGCGCDCCGFATIEFADDAGDVGAGFGEGRDAVIAVDRGGAGVVGGYGESWGIFVVVSIGASEELVEVGGAAGDVFVRREAVVGRRGWKRFRA